MSVVYILDSIVFVKVLFLIIFCSFPRETFGKLRKPVRWQKIGQLTSSSRNSSSNGSHSSRA